MVNTKYKEIYMSKFKKIFICFCFLTTISLTACLSTYTYNGVKFDTSELALSAQDVNNEEILNKITPTKNKVGGSAIVFLPSISLIEKNGVKVTGKPNPEHIKHIATSFQKSLGLEANSLKKRQIFDSVKITESDNPESVDFSEDVAVYFTMPGYGLGQWLLKKKGSQPGDPIPITFDTSLSLPELRILSLLGSIERAAK